MKLWSNSFKDNEPIPPEFALCARDPTRHAVYSDNKNPDLLWSDVPGGTRSLALICHDRDAPSIPNDVNEEGKRLRHDLPRVDFFHWVMVDMPPDMVSIGGGQFSDGVTARGKPGPEVPGEPRMRHGINDYTQWFKRDPDMEGTYYGYDGPCPPWNDDLIHRYVFTLYALDIDRVPVDGKFTGQQVRAAIQGHILGEAKLTGTYTLDPALGAQFRTK
jgi:Raf kinase inhibitor-like YbhB/YbcL family protein